jgi:hypothetical protein
MKDDKTSSESTPEGVEARAATIAAALAAAAERMVPVAGTGLPDRHQPAQPSPDRTSAKKSG